MSSINRVDLDRRTWASPTAIVFTYGTKGAGALQTEQLDFGIAYEGPPFFSYGTSLARGELVEGDYPFVTIGVTEWITKVVDDEDFVIKKIKPLHVGAILWIAVSSRESYELEHNLIFEGVAFKNPMVV